MYTIATELVWCVFGCKHKSYPPSFTWSLTFRAVAINAPDPRSKWFAGVVIYSLKFPCSQVRNLHTIAYIRWTWFPVFFWHFNIAICEQVTFIIMQATILVLILTFIQCIKICFYYLQNWSKWATTDRTEWRWRHCNERSGDDRSDLFQEASAARSKVINSRAATWFTRCVKGSGWLAEVRGTP